MGNDATWREMTEVCLRLGHRDEALLSYERIRDPRLRREAEHMLQRRGLLKTKDGLPPEEPAELPRTLRENIVEATRVLFEDHMPLTTIVTTMTFPIVVGLGGFLTSSTSSSFLFPAIAALPALCMAAVVGGMSRRILIEAARGLQDPPRIPQVRELSRQSGRFLLDALVLTLVFLGPAVALGCTQGMAVSTLLAAVLGAFLLPAAMAIRQLTDDWRALSANCLFTAVTRLRGDYAATAGVCTLVALPATATALLTAGSHLYLQASVVGPLAVAPLFFASRLLGLMVHGHREQLSDLLAPRVQPATAKPVATAAALRDEMRDKQPETKSYRDDLARPTMRTTTATPPRVAAVPRTPRPDEGPLPTAAPRPILSDQRPAARQETPAARAAAAATRIAREPMGERQPAPARTTKPAAAAASPAPAAQPTAKPTAKPEARPTPAAREPHPVANAMEKPMANPVAKPAAKQVAKPVAKQVAKPAEPQTAPALAKRPGGGTHRAVATAAAAPAMPPAIAEPHPAPVGLGTDQTAPKPRVAVTEKAPPDFTQMPGFNVVTGAARVLAGAAARAGGKRR